MNRLLSKLVVYLLKHRTLKLEDKMRVTNALLQNIDSLPITDVITYKDGVVTIGGKKLDFEQAQNIIVSARALEDNLFRKIIREQVNYEAIKMGIHNGLSPDTILFAKAALWYNEQEQQVLNNILIE